MPLYRELWIFSSNSSFISFLNLNNLSKIFCQWIFISAFFAIAHVGEVIFCLFYFTWVTNGVIHCLNNQIHSNYHQFCCFKISFKFTFVYYFFFSFIFKRPSVHDDVRHKRFWNHQWLVSCLEMMIIELIK